MNDAGRSALLFKQPPTWKGWGFAVAVCAAATATGLPFRAGLNPENAAMLYLVGIALAAVRYGRASCLLACLISAAAYNFFFTQPYYSFQVYSYRDVVTIALLLMTSLIIGALAARLKAQSLYFQQKEQSTAALYVMARELASTRGRAAIAAIATRHVGHAFNSPVTLWLPDAEGELRVVQGNSSEIQTALWAFEHQEQAGRGTATLPGADGFYMPLMAVDKAVGVLGIADIPEGQQGLLAAFASLIAAALGRANAADSAERHKVEAEREKLRNTLLSSVSHDLRTPLASITGAASSLLLAAEELPIDARELAASIHSESARLARTVTNLLQVTKLESGSPQLNRQPYYMDELIGSALSHSSEMLANYTITTCITDELPLMHIDGLLIEQVLTNLLENAAHYAPHGSAISITATQTPYAVEVSVSDSGQGITSGMEEKIFDKFYTARQNDRSPGTGLGLAICKGIVGAHGGRVWAANASGGGAVFIFSLPLAANALPVEEAA